MDAGRKCIDKLRRCGDQGDPPHHIHTAPDPGPGPYCPQPNKTHTETMVMPTLIIYTTHQTAPPTPTRKYEVLQLRHSHTRTRILCCLTSLVSYRQTFHVSILTLDIWDGLRSVQYYGQHRQGVEAWSYGVHEICLLLNSITIQLNV